MSFQQVLARMVFAMPAGVLRALAGGRRTAGEAELDPHIALMARQAEGRPPMTSLPVAVAREGMRRAFGLIDAPLRPGVEARDLTVPGGAGQPLEARLHTPRGVGERAPLVVYFHQGGCVLGGVWTCDPWCSLLADEARCRVLNIDYRHAPEHKFPAAVEDAAAAFDWTLAHAADLGADASRIAVGGDSAGGYLSAVVCCLRKQAGLGQPRLQLLIYPCTDWTAVGGTMQTMANAYPLSQPIMEWFAGHYLSSDDERTDWRVSPALYPDKAGLAPALVYAAGFDPLTSQAKAYADMLAAAGVKTLQRTYPSLSHSFTAMSGVVPGARRALVEIAADVRAALA